VSRDHKPMVEASKRGTQILHSPIARMHSFSASRLLLISAPSSRVCRLLPAVSAPLSDPGTTKL
jgi:hypothetical protein